VSAERRNVPAVVEAAAPVKAATLRSTLAVPAVIAGAGDHAARRFLEFFAATIRNKNTRMAYYRAACHFFAWIEQHRIGELADIEPIHVAAYIEVLQTTAAKPTVKLHLAAIHMLFDWLVVGQVLAVNPAHAVRGPKHVVRRGKTPVLTEDQARHLLDSIDVTTVVGLRDRALISVMIYSFARIGAVVAMRELAAFGASDKRHVGNENITFDYLRKDSVGHRRCPWYPNRVVIHDKFNV
jgi:integrase/recombinase XerD